MSLDLDGALERGPIHEDSVREIHLLAARLRADFGELDDAAIQAVSEATGAPEDFVRLAVRSAPVEEKRTLLDRLKGSFLAFDPDRRRYTMACVLAAASGLTCALAGIMGDRSGFMGTVALLAGIGALWNAAVAKDAKAGLISGVLFGGVSFIVQVFFTFLFNLLPYVPNVHGESPGLLLLYSALGGFAGLASQRIVSGNRAKLGLRDPAKERQDLLQQLQDIQERLKSDERFVTFLSVDIVGSTKLKAESDPLTVEFTFGEYQKYVQAVVEKFGGKVHSTAGDGVTCVFENPQMAYVAGRSVLAGLFEFNSFRNRLAQPIEVRAGVHTGSAHIPGQALTNVNFAHVIDVAAHMQKAGDPGSLVVSQTTAQYLPGGLDGIGPERLEVQDIPAAIWKPRMALAPTPATASGL